MQVIFVWYGESERKGFPMRVSNWIVYGLAAVASIVLLGLWHGLGFSAVHGTLDLALTVGWWALIVGGAVCVWRSDVARRRRVQAAAEVQKSQTLEKESA